MSSETLTGTAADEYFVGGDGDDLIDGGAGRDIAAFQLPPGTPGSFRLVEGTGADAGSFIVERVDGSTVEAVFRITLTGEGSAIVTGLGSVSALGTDTVSNIEELHFLVPQDPFNPDQFLNVPLTPNAWTYEPNNHAGVEGTPGHDVIDLADYHQDKDASWDRFANAGYGDDRVIGTAFDEQVDGGAGADTLEGGGGDDGLMGRAGNDRLVGGDGRDVANYELPAGLTGQFRTVAGPQPGQLILQRVDGATIEDLFRIAQTGPGTFEVTGLGAYAGYGVDTLEGIEGISFWSPNGPGWWVPLAPSAWVYEPNTDVGVDGTGFDDQINLADYQWDAPADWDRIVNGRDGNDLILGTTGNERLNGELGNDTLQGDAGADTMQGGAGHDSMSGGDGADRFFGGHGADTMSGGAGNDVIILAEGNPGLPRVNGDDVIDGGDGFDVVSFWSAPNAVRVSLWDTGPQATGFGTLTLTNVEGIEGGRGNDELHGNNEDNWLSGGFAGEPSGNDLIFANGGDDVLLGRDGDDYLVGGEGDDYVHGGLGRDVAAFNLAPGTTGTFRLAQGVGADAGSLIVERVDGATVEAVFRISQTPEGVTVTGLGSAAALGTDTVVAVEELHFLVPQDPFNPDQFLNVNVAPSAWTYEPNQHVGVDGTPFADVIDVDDYHADADPTWARIVNGREGDDLLSGGEGVNFLNGDAGADTLQGEGGDDQLRGGAGDDRLVGGAGRDTVNIELAEGLTGQLRTVAGTQPGQLILQRVDGATVEDLFRIEQTGFGAFTVTGLGAYAGEGTDTIEEAEGLSFFSPNGPGFWINLAPTAWVYEPNTDVGVDGTPFADAIDLAQFTWDAPADWDRFVNGREGDDLISGTAGNERLNGDAGADTVQGLAGADTLQGGAGADSLSGGEGADRFFGGHGADTMSGGAGNDVIILAEANIGLPRENGDDVIDGGDGFDVVSFWSAPNAVRVSLWDTGPQATGFGTLTLTNVEGIEGGRGNDELHGNNEDNWLSGGFAGEPSGNDLIFANGGNDVLLGRDGDDYLVGGEGDDYVHGGSGRDVAAFNLAPGTTGTFRLVAGTGADAGRYFVERVDGATVETVFRLERTADGYTVTGLGSAANQGVDTVVAVEELHFLVPQDPFNPEQFLSVRLAPTAWTYEPNHHIGVDGTPMSDVINLADFHQDKDGTWGRFVNAGAGDDLVIGTGFDENIDGQDGADTLQGGGGDDGLMGGAGNDRLVGGEGRDRANYELPEGLAGQLRVVAGPNGTLLVQRVDGAIVEDLLRITKTGAESFTVEGLGSVASLGTDLVEGVEGLSVWVRNGAENQNAWANLTPNAWVYEPNHHIGVDGTGFDDVIALSSFHQDKDASWGRFANGGGGSDSIAGTGFNESINGDDGADTLSGGGGDDNLRGGRGDDVIDGGAGANDVAAFALPSGTQGTLHQVAGVGAEAGRVFIELRHDGVATRIFEVTAASDGSVTVRGLGPAAEYGADVVRGVEQLHFFVEQGAFVAVRLTPFVPPLANNAFVNGTFLGEVIDLAALYPTAGANLTLNANGQDGADTVSGHDGFNNLNGGAGADSISGRGGDDLLRGGDGQDVFDGGAGFDRISFYDAFATQGAEADLATGLIANDGYGNAETMTSIEGIGSGTRFADRFFGDDGGNLLMGGSNDVLHGRGGDDSFIVGGAPETIDGGSGRDSVRFSESRTADLNGDGVAEEEQATRGVVADLSQQRVLDDGFGQSGALLNVEILAGTAFGDTLTGDAGANELYGNGGGDRLDGGAGDDLLFGGPGADTLTGGAGTDTALFSGARSGYTVAATAGGYLVTDTNTADGDEGTSLVQGVELLQFADQVMSLASGVSISPAQASVLEGSAGQTRAISFTVTRTGDLSTSLELPYSVSPTGANPVDSADLVNGLAGGVVRFEAGASSATITIQVRGDADIEANETFAVTLGQPASGGAVDFLRQQATGVINNDDNPTDIPPGWVGGINFGDPHIVTLDGLQYEMQGVGEFVLVKSVEGPAIEVQVRTAPVSAYASEISAVAIEAAGVRIAVYADRASPLTVNGETVSLAVGQDSLSVGTEGAVISRYSQNGQEGWLISFGEGFGAAVLVLDLGDRLDVTFAASPDRMGDFQGLLGNFNGNAADDLPTGPNGQPLSFEAFYSDFVNAWRITQTSDSLFDYAPGESPATFNDLAFPPAQISVSDFPAELVTAAEALADAAGITDPALREAAVKDFLLTGDSSFFASGSGASGTITTPPTVVEVTPPANPPLAAVGVGATVVAQDEGQAGTTTYAFTVYRTSGTGEQSVDWTVSGATFHGVSRAADAADFVGPLSGTVTFADGQTQATVLVQVTGDTVFEGDEGFRFAITPAAGTPVLAGSVQVTILNDDVAPAPTNRAPVVANPIADQQPAEDAAFSFQIPAGAFSDPDGDALTYSATLANGSPLPGWLTFDAATRTFSGAPQAGEADVVVRVTASDGVLTVHDDFIIAPQANPGETWNGGKGADSKTGTAGQDTLDGGEAADTIDGGAGADRIVGGKAADVLTGGAGRDTFVYGDNSAADRITDFEVGVDRLLLVDGVTIKRWEEVDTDKDGTADSTLVHFAKGGSVLLEDVLGIDSAADLTAPGWVI